MDQKQAAKDQPKTRKFVELTLKEEASLAEVTLVSGLLGPDSNPGI